MTPDTEETIRIKLRHLRRALHYLMLAGDIGWFGEDEISGVEIDLKRLVEITADELERLRKRDESGRQTT